MSRERPAWQAMVAIVLFLTMACASCAGGDSRIDWQDEAATAVAPPPGPTPPSPGFSAVLDSVPLLVDGRLRVTATSHGVSAAPIASPAGSRPHWSYSRSESSADLAAMALARPHGRGPLVGVLWDDGGLVGLDALSGTPVWRSDAAATDSAFLNSFEPDRVVGSPFLAVAGEDVFVVRIGQDLIGVDAATGKGLWRETPAGCPTNKEYDLLGWWPVGDSLVVDATCFRDQLDLRVLRPRDGTQTHRLTPGTMNVRVSALGCDHTGSGCALLRVYVMPSPGGGEPPPPSHWRVAGGRLVKARAVRGAGIEAVPGGSQIQAVDLGTGKTRWLVHGETHDLGKMQFRAADATKREVWAGSDSWNGGPPALVRLAVRDGSLTGCLPPPTGKPVTLVHAYEEGYVVVSDVPDEDSAQAPSFEGTFMLLVPRPRPKCR